MKLRVNLLTGLFFLIALPAVSQPSEPEVPVQTLKSAVYLPGEIFTFYMQAYGTQYFNDEWLPGDIALANGREIRDVLLRYNAYLDELIWLPDINTNPVKIDKGMVHRFLFNSSGNARYPFVKIDLKELAESENGEIYAQELHAGKVSLYAHRKVVKTSEHVESSGRTTYAKPVISPDTDYYIQKSDGSFQALRRINLRGVSHLFPGKEREVRRFLRKNNLRIRNEGELIKAMGLINDNFPAEVSP